MKNEKGLKKWLALAMVLAALTAVLVILLHTHSGRISGYVDISGFNAEKAIILSELNLNESQKIISSGGEEFQGYLVRDILALGGIDINSIQNLTFTSGDGVRMMLSKEEIVKRDIILVPQTGRGVTEYRLIIPQDMFRNRWLKNVIIIEVD